MQEAFGIYAERSRPGEYPGQIHPDQRGPRGGDAGALPYEYHLRHTVPGSGRAGAVDGLRAGVPLGVQSADAGEVSAVTDTPQNGDRHQFPPLELVGCTRFAQVLPHGKRFARPCPPKTVKYPMLPTGAGCTKLEFMPAKVRKAVFPAAGLGTRFLPATKAQPKEMLRSEEHTSELQSLRHLVCRLLLEKKKLQPIPSRS